jgi:hypothetical protein
VRVEQRRRNLQRLDSSAIPSFLPRLPFDRMFLASKLLVHNALADNVANDSIEACGVIGLAIVKPIGLLIQVTEEMEWLD